MTITKAENGLSCSFFFVFFLWLLREAVGDGKEGVAAHGVSPGLGTALGVNTVAKTGYLT